MTARITLFSLLIATLLLSPYAEAAECLRKATKADIAALGPSSGVKEGACIDKATEALLNPKLSGSAKEYLKSLRRESNRCGTASDESIDRLNSDFAICAAAFMQAYSKEYSVTFKITSAYRSPAQQQCVCPRAVPGLCGAVGASNHQRGVAMDIHPTDGNYRRMADFARTNPQFGVCFPLAYKATPDRPHIILAGIGGGEGGNCARQGVTKNCTGNDLSLPVLRPTGTYSEQSPLQNLFGLLGFGGQSQECQQLEQQCKIYQGQACMAYAQKCQNGGSPSAGSPPSSPMVGAPPKPGSEDATDVEEIKPPEKDKGTTDTLTDAANTTKPEDTEEKKPVTILTASSSAEELAKIAVTKPATTTATTTRGLSEDDITRLAAEKTTIKPQLPQDTLFLEPQDSSDTKITSFDTTFEPTFESGTSPETLFGIQSTLSRMKQALEWMLVFVTPMGYTRSVWEESIE